MSNLAPALPDNPALLKAMIAALQAENAKISATLRAHDQLIQTLRLRIAKLKKQVFGQSSEKIEREIEQLELALEDLLIASAESEVVVPDGDLEDAGLEAADDTADRPSRRRPRVSDRTPRERQELDPGSCCPDCGGDLRVVGEDVSEMLDLIAAQLKVVQIARPKKSCRRCERMVQVPAPSRPIPGSMVGAGLLAHILVSKFDDHLPFCDRAGLVNGDDGPTSRSILLSVVGAPPQDADCGGRDAPKLYLGLNRAMGKSELIPSVVPARDVTPSPKGAGSQ